MKLGTIGVWSGELRGLDESAAKAAAAKLESWGYGTLWINNGRDREMFRRVRALLSATERVVIATGILNIFDYAAAEVAEAYHAINVDFPDRFLLGLGVSHGRDKTFDAMVAFLDGLDSAPNPVPKANRTLAALGPRMLKLAAERSAGAHPYNVSVEQTREARQLVGSGVLLAPEQGFVLESSPARALAVARSRMGFYLNAPNYIRNFKRGGFTDDDLKDGGSERLIESFIVWGNADAVAGRVRQQLDAGADHVCIQALTDTPDQFPLDSWQALAQALIPA